MDAREADRVAEERCGSAEIERARRPQLEEPIEQQKDDSREEPEEAIHTDEATFTVQLGQCGRRLCDPPRSDTFLPNDETETETG